MVTFKFSFQVEQQEQHGFKILVEQGSDGTFRITRQRDGLEEPAMEWGCVNGFLMTGSVAARTAEAFVRFVSSEFGRLHFYDDSEVTWRAEEPEYVTSKRRLSA
jgi:hypothetical protein